MCLRINVKYATSTSIPVYEYLQVVLAAAIWLRRWNTLEYAFQRKVGLFGWMQLRSSLQALELHFDLTSTYHDSGAPAPHAPSLNKCYLWYLVTQYLLLCYAAISGPISHHVRRQISMGRLSLAHIMPRRHPDRAPLRRWCVCLVPTRIQGVRTTTRNRP